MNLEYEVTIEDELNARYTDWVLWLKEGNVLLIPARNFPLLISVSSIGLIIWGLLTQVREDRYLLLSSGAFCFLISILLFFLYKPKNALSSSNRRDIEKEHQKYYPNREQRNIILTAENLVFKTASSENAWTWQALKSFTEEDRGFEFNFYSGHKRFIPKRIFTSEHQLNNFRNIVGQYKSTAQI